RRTSLADIRTKPVGGQPRTRGHSRIRRWQATRTYVAAAAASGQPASGQGAEPVASGPGGGQRRRVPDPAGRYPNRRRLLIGGAAAVALIILLSVGIYLATEPRSSGTPTA